MPTSIPTSTGAPTTLPFSISHHPLLSRSQAGHLRHTHNLSSTLPGEWALMGSAVANQEHNDGLRFQLATLAYGAGLAHYHRLPALRSSFKALLERLIGKMLLRDVWGYWYLTSQGGRATNPDLERMRTPWADPVVKENIMYSGHLLLMTTLYAMLFDDDRYEAPGALTFVHDPLFYGFGPEEFSYTRSTLQDVVLDSMAREGWLGVCCEPNAIFVVCNQFHIIALRYDDVRKGTDTATLVLQKYTEAWRKRGLCLDGGGEAAMPVDFFMVQQAAALHSGDHGLTTWAGAVLNSWNPTFARSLYGPALQGMLTQQPHGRRYNLNHKSIIDGIRALVAANSTIDPQSLAVATAVRTELATSKGQQYLQEEKPAESSAMPTKPQFAYVAQFISEVGPREHLDGILMHADQFLGPSWRDGGLYYARCDEPEDESGEWTLCDPYTGNAGIAYARLNVPDGQRAMYERPWTKELLRSRPWIEGVGFEDGVDFLRAVWDDRNMAMVMTLRSWSDEEKKVVPVVKGLQPGTYAVYVDGYLTSTKDVDGKETEIELELLVDGMEVDVVVVGMDE